MLDKLDKKTIENLILTVVDIAKLAGAKILQVYHSDDFAVETKTDASPVTQADFAANEIIVSELNKITPQLPVLSEEAADISFAERSQWQCYWLVDPLDGTREFIKKSGEFSVNIALIENHRPILGVIYVPVENVCYFAAENYGVFQQQDDQAPTSLQVRSWSPTQLAVLMSRYSDIERFDNILSQFDGCQIERLSSSIKFGLIATGKFDLYPRLGPTSEWDTAAGQCIVEQAGGSVVDFTGQPLRYNTKESLTNPQFLVLGDGKELLFKLLELFRV